MSKVIKRYCDACGKEIEEPGYFYVLSAKRVNSISLGEGHTKYADLCKDCFKTLIKVQYFQENV